MAGFWTSNTEPLRKNRWTMIFNGKGKFNSISYALKKADRPSYKTSEITHKFGNYSFYYPGRVEWNTINITFASVYADGSTPGASQIILGIFKDYLDVKPPSGEKAQKNALHGLQKKKFVDTIGTGVDLISLGSDGDDTKFIEKWTLVNPFFTNIKFGDLSYDSDEIVDIECTVRYDSAAYTPGSANEETKTF